MDTDVMSAIRSINLTNLQSWTDLKKPWFQDDFFKDTQ